MRKSREAGSLSTVWKLRQAWSSAVQETITLLVRFLSPEFQHAFGFDHASFSYSVTQIGHCNLSLSDITEWHIVHEAAS